MIQDMDFKEFMRRYGIGRDHGDSRTKIRYVEYEDHFILLYSEVDNIINRTTYDKEAIYTNARLEIENIDSKREIERWKMEYLRDATEGIDFESQSDI